MSNLVFEKLAQSLGASAVWRLGIAADFFRIVESAWPVKVRILKAGRILGTMEGWQAGDYLRGVDFDAVEIENGANAQAVTVQIAGGGVGSDRVIGEVSVIDGGMARTKAGVAFIASEYISTSAGNYGHVQLWNPAGSGKRLIVEAINASLGSASTIALCKHNARLAAPIVVPESKRIGGADVSVAEVVEYQAASVAGSSFWTVLGQNVVEKRFFEPVVIEPGNSILVRSLAGVGVNCAFEYYEESA